MGSKMAGLDESLADFDREEAAFLVLGDRNGVIPLDTFNSEQYLEYQLQGLMPDYSLDG